MAIKRQAKRASRRTQIIVDEGWRRRVRKPKITDPKRRRETIEQATSLIKTTARIDTVSLGRE